MIEGHAAMSAARKLKTPIVKRASWISVDDYLRGELVSPIKHEYVDGFVYAMAGARNAHTDIAGNTFGSLFIRLRGRKCRPRNSDAKVRIRLPRKIRFYYPDVSIVCRPNSRSDQYHDRPVVIAEVISESTRRIDEGEKKEAYLTIPTLDVYLIIEQDSPKVLAYRRKGRGFVQEVYSGLKAIIPLPEIGTELPLAEIYEAVEFVPVQDNEEKTSR
jgi:Uma2 family endonuclease